MPPSLKINALLSCNVEEEASGYDIFDVAAVVFLWMSIAGHGAQSMLNYRVKLT